MTSPVQVTTLFAVQLSVAPIAADEAEGAEIWRELLDACVDVVETGSTSGLSGWTETGETRPACITGGGTSDCALDLRRWRSGSGATIWILDPLSRPAKGVVTACQSGPTRALPGNDAQGLALRALAHDVLEPRLSFHEEDQILAPDVWRGCAYDGREYRLSSMTQVTWAQFGIAVSSTDPSCAKVVS